MTVTAHAGRWAMEPSGLLPLTMQHAARAPFYVKHWGRGWRDLRFEEIPLVYRTDIVNAGGDAQIFEPGCDLSFTGGTSDFAFPHLIGSSEQICAAKFFDEVYAGSQFSNRARRRALRFVNPYICYERRVPSPVRTHNINIYSRGVLPYCLDQILPAEYREDGIEPFCSLLIGAQRLLVAFTDYARARRKPVFHNLERIITYGSYLTSEVRRRIEEFWEVPIIDRFGLSEVTGGATQSSDCGWYFFGPTVYAEVVGHHSKEPIKEGVGVLVLTALWPFQQCQPLVRYFTGDVVEVTHSRSSLPDHFAIRPLGRLNASVAAVGSDEWLMTADVLLEALESTPGVGRELVYQDAPDIQFPSNAGSPRFLLDEYNGQTRRVTLHVYSEIRDPNMSRDIHAKIMRSAPGFNAAVSRGQCEFSICNCIKDLDCAD